MLARFHSVIELEKKALTDKTIEEGQVNKHFQELLT